MRVGIGGVVLGGAPDDPFVVRLFRRQPTRVVCGVPEYVTWLMAFRAIAVGAHLRVRTDDPSSWTTLAEVVTACGGTIEVTPPDDVRGVGVAYRPLLVIDHASTQPTQTARPAALGAWQTVVTLTDLASAGAVHALRTADMTLASPADARIIDHLARAYALTDDQMAAVSHASASDVVVAMPRLLTMVAMIPTPVEYGLLFGR